MIIINSLTEAKKVPPHNLRQRNMFDTTFKECDYMNSNDISLIV